MLKYNLERVVDVGDFDDLVKMTYGKPYSYQQQDGCKSRGVHYFKVHEAPRDYLIDDYQGEPIPSIGNGEMGVAFSTWLETPPEEHKRLFWERYFYPDFDMVIDDLTRRGLIEPGKYMINIDW